MTSRIAIVTGANKGIGLEICRQLAQQDIHVILTARDAGKGEVARQTLAQQGANVSFHVLDVTDERSIEALAHEVEKRFGAPDILINNAGVSLDGFSSGVVDLALETLHATMQTNLYGPAMLCKAMLPLMQRKNYGRIVNVSSGMGQLSEMSRGAPAYRISKTALNALTRNLAAEVAGGNILVNAMCPGWVRTDMGGANAPRSVEQGAATAVWLATLPDGGPSGGLFRDRKAIAW